MEWSIQIVRYLRELKLPELSSVQMSLAIKKNWRLREWSNRWISEESDVNQ